MKIISKQYNCVGTIVNGKSNVIIDMTTEKIIPNDDEDNQFLSEHSTGNSISLAAKDIAQKNEHAKKLKGMILGNGVTGTITLKYLG